MRTVKSCAGMQRLARQWQRAGVPVALVPTMGFLHAGHISLIHRARRAVGRRGRVVVSIYVNPTQFAPTEDLKRYPRDREGDLRQCRSAGADAVFLPSDAEMYPAGFSTYVEEQALSRGMEGASRPTHFRGVTTVVAKLFLLTQPGVAVFGAKDCQQAAVVRRMARDLNFPVRIVVAETLREEDGLAMSSRNHYLSPAQRAQAIVLWRMLEEARRQVRAARQPLSAAQLRRRLQGLLRQAPEARMDYIEFFQPDTLAPVRRVRRGDHMALAVWIGPTRLIDNATLE